MKHLFHLIRFLIIIIAANGFLYLSSCGNKKTHPTIADSPLVDTSEKKLQILNKRILDDPNNPSLLYQRAMVFYNMKNLYKGMEDIIRAINMDSSEVKYHLLLADFYYADTRIDEARERIEKALSLNPNDINANIKMGELMFYLADYVKMFTHLDIALKQDPYNAKIYFIKGMGFKEMGDTNLAISSFATTIEQDPEYFDAYMQLGNLHATRHNPIAIQYYNNAIRINPLMIEAHYGLAYYLQENGKPDDAIKIYNDLLSIDPSNAVANHNIGYIFLFYKNDPAASLQWFNRSVSLNPKAANTYYHRGYAYELLHDFEKAKENYNLAIEASQNQFPMATERLARIQNK
ncbi:MAG: tetratricopeptide repeat protein [Candidatus Competibacteraceae bacterium]|nr:tetratricopeptide repeat protein [Candidatus Competibacteraceae bacterium]